MLVDSTSKGDMTSLDSITSIIDQKSQLLTKKLQKSNDMGIQTENSYVTTSENISKGSKQDSVSVDIKSIVESYISHKDLKSIGQCSKENSVKFKDLIKVPVKIPCFKTSPKNNLPCTCIKKIEESKSSNILENSQNSFLLKDETSMMVPLSDLLADLESSDELEHSIKVSQKDSLFEKDELINIINILNH